MPSRSTPGPNERHAKRVPGLLALALSLTTALLLGGCSSDEASSSNAARGAARSNAVRSRDATTDSGSRFMDAAGPVGGLTAETPPVVAPPALAP